MKAAFSALGAASAAGTACYIPAMSTRFISLTLALLGAPRVR